jgi:plastocyanin
MQVPAPNHVRRLTRAVLLTVASLGLLLGLTSPATAADRTVTVRDNVFVPKKLNVQVGDQVEWDWKGSNAHNVTVTKGPKKFRSKTQSSGTYRQTIAKPGKYQIACTLHGGMKMTVVAKAAPATTAPPAS